MARRDSDGITAKITMVNRVQLVERSAKIEIRFIQTPTIVTCAMALAHGIPQGTGELLEFLDHERALLL